MGQQRRMLQSGQYVCLKTFRWKRHLPIYYVQYLIYFCLWDLVLCFFPPRGAFVITPSIACHFQSILLVLSQTDNPSIHIRLNTPAFLHSWNLSCTVLEDQDFQVQHSTDSLYVECRISHSQPSCHSFLDDQSSFSSSYVLMVTEAM